MVMTKLHVLFEFETLMLCRLSACVPKAGGVVRRQTAALRLCVLAKWFIVPTSANATRLAKLLTSVTPQRLYDPAVGVQTDLYYTLRYRALSGTDSSVD